MLHPKFKVVYVHIDCLKFFFFLHFTEEIKRIEDEKKQEEKEKEGGDDDVDDKSVNKTKLKASEIYSDSGSDSEKSVKSAKKPISTVNRRSSSSSSSSRSSSDSDSDRR